MRRECQVKSFEGLGPFSYVCRMMRFSEPNTNELEPGEGSVYSERCVGDQHYVCVVNPDQQNSERVRGFPVEIDVEEGEIDAGENIFDFFLSECCMAQRRSLSGRSPFCQRKLSEESQIHWKSFSAKATNLKRKTKKHQPRCSLPESAGAVGCSLFLGRLDQGLVGNAESTHVNRPKGKATLVP